MPYRENSLYVTLREAIDEIARVYYPTDHVEAADDFTQACKDGKLKALFEVSHQEVGGWEWRQEHQSVHSSNLIVRRADLLVIYPDLWKELPPKTANPAKGQYVYNKTTKRIEFRSPVDATDTLAGVAETVRPPALGQTQGQPLDNERGQSVGAAIDDQLPSRRDQQKQETVARYERWYDRSQEFKGSNKPSTPIGICKLIAKKEKADGYREVMAETIKRRLNKDYGRWAD